MIIGITRSLFENEDQFEHVLAIALDGVRAPGYK
jgi:hypothetical protein